MKIPRIKGIIERRMLINYAVDPSVVRKVLPAQFKPQLVNSQAIAGICLIRLKNIRPAGLPAFTGLKSENAAHRIAVEWTENGETKQGVYIPRRDTNSTFNHIVGGRLFPGVHYLSKFDVLEHEENFEISISHNGQTLISVKAHQTNAFNAKSVFSDFNKASEFFRKGAIGFSPNTKGLDGLELKTDDWKVEPLEAVAISSTFFEDESMFPKGSVTFDNALLMQNIPHEWHSYAADCIS